MGKNLEIIYFNTKEPIPMSKWKRFALASAYDVFHSIMKPKYMDLEYIFNTYVYNLKWPFDSLDPCVEIWRKMEKVAINELPYEEKYKSQLSLSDRGLLWEKWK